MVDEVEEEETAYMSYLGGQVCVSHSILHKHI